MIIIYVSCSNRQLAEQAAKPAAEAESQPAQTREPSPMTIDR